MTVRRRLAVIAAEGLVLAGLLLLVADVRAHARVERLGGVNVWGYRGPVAHQRRDGEIRVAIVGGTRAYGWGAPSGMMSATLRQLVMLRTDRPGRPLRPVVMVDLGQLGQLPDGYAATLTRYAYLAPDMVCIYDDLGERGAGTPPASGIQARTGYAPILPLVLREKAFALRFGEVSRGYRGAGAAAPGSSLPRRSMGRALALTADVLAAGDRWMAPGSTGDVRAPGLSPTEYAAQVVDALEAAHRRSPAVVLALSPAETPGQVARRDELLARLPSGVSWLRVVDLSAWPDLTAPESRIDGWNYSSLGLSRVAEHIAPALLSLIPDA